MRTELENLVCLEEKFADWEKQLESKLASSERISEKTKTDKKQFTKEMQKQVLKCIYIYNRQHSLYAGFLVRSDSEVSLYVAYDGILQISSSLQYTYFPDSFSCNFTYITVLNAIY